MSFKLALLDFLQLNLVWWEVSLNENENILIVIEEDKDLELFMENFPAILMFIITEVCGQPEKVNFTITNHSRSHKYDYTFTPGNSSN